MQANWNKFMDESLEIRESEGVEHARDFSRRMVFEPSGEGAAAANFAEILSEIFCDEIDELTIAV
ncbi:MAG: hypothetical protein LBU73_10085 [Helicobacteraceae bacterium]|jgi:hypothetical protein|nr:hypothetical protein [Helicobacteraceae bacterium]